LADALPQFAERVARRLVLASMLKVSRDPALKLRPLVEVQRTVFQLFQHCFS
jgi:hypothetical protein